MVNMEAGTERQEWEFPRKELRVYGRELLTRRKESQLSLAELGVSSAELQL